MNAAPRGPDRRGGAARAPSPRSVARERAMRALYQWQIAGGDYAALRVQAEQAEPEEIEAGEGNVAPHAGLLDELLQGVLAHAEALDVALAPHLDRAVNELSPIEHAILLIAAYELAHSVNVPYKVCINEAVELAKRYGGTDGHKFVNGVLDKLARATRRVEIEAAGKA